MIWERTSRRPSRRSIEFFESSGASAYGYDVSAFCRLVEEVESRYLDTAATARQREAFLDKLHMKELLLARACARGDEPAWDEFMRTYREKLRIAARSITHEVSNAEDLADSLFAELFGLRTRDGARVSKLSSYMGLGSLEGWLYTLLAQAHVDRWRRDRRQVALDESDHLRTLMVAPNQSNGNGGRILHRHMERAVENVLSGVAGQPRLLLSLYFLDGQTLAQIGRFFHVHESTVSRRLDRVLAMLRRRTLVELRRMGLARPAAIEALKLDPRFLQVDVRKVLSEANAGDPS